jgi:hypothetical protein
MKAFQRIFDSAVESLGASIVSKSISASPIMPSDPDDRPPIYSMLQRDVLLPSRQQEAKRPRDLLKWWVICVIALLIISALVICGFLYLGDKPKPGIVISDALWAIFFGVCALYFLPQKILTGLFGTVLGLGANEAAAGGAGIIKKANESITDIATQIGVVVDSSKDAAFIGQCIWLFVILFGVLCLPAFFLSRTDDSQS